MQASRLWQMTLRKALVEMKFRQCTTDPCLYVLTVDGKTAMILGIYVDDIIVMHNDGEVPLVGYSVF